MIIDNVDMHNILLLGCGTQGLALVKCLKKAGHTVVLLGEKNNYADKSRYIDHKYYTTFRPLSKDYLALVIDVIKSHDIHSIVPMGDINAEFLSVNKGTLLQFVKYKMPDHDVFLRATDKNKLMQLCAEKGYPHPFTINSVDNISSVKQEILSFPLLIKPNITCGARGMTLVNSYDELIEKYALIRKEYGECHLQKYVKQGGAQVEVQLYIDENQRLLNSSVIYKYRWYPEKGGSSCCAVSVRNDRIVNILYNLLKDLNWVGFADFDTIEDPDTGELLIMELNPRVPACVKTAVEAGINWGEIIVNDYLGKAQKNYIYKEGEYLRHLGFEVLWFMKSKNRFKTSPCWFNFIGKHIHYQDMSDWSDPMPFLTGTWRNVKKVITHSEKTRINR